MNILEKINTYKTTKILHKIQIVFIFVLSWHSEMVSNVEAQGGNFTRTTNFVKNDYVYYLVFFPLTTRSKKYSFWILHLEASLQSLCDWVRQNFWSDLWWSKHAHLITTWKYRKYRKIRELNASLRYIISSDLLNGTMTSYLSTLMPLLDT